MDVVLDWDGVASRDPQTTARATAVGQQLRVALEVLLGEPVGVTVVDALSDCTGRPVTSIMFQVVPLDGDVHRAASKTCAALNRRAGDELATLWDDGGDVIWIFTDALDACLEGLTDDIGD